MNEMEQVAHDKLVAEAEEAEQSEIEELTNQDNNE